MSDQGKKIRKMEPALKSLQEKPRPKPNRKKSTSEKRKRKKSNDVKKPQNVRDLINEDISNIGKQTGESLSLEELSKNQEFLESFELANIAFKELKQIFQDIIQMLSEDKHLSKFRLEYEKLHRLLLKSRENEKSLMKKCVHLNNEIIKNARKVQMALQISEDDQKRIGILKREIERVWNMVESAYEKEQKTNKGIETLRAEISELNKLIDEGMGATKMNEITKSEMNEYIKVLNVENKQHTFDIEGYNREIVDVKKMKKRMVKNNQDKMVETKNLVKRQNNFMKNLEEKKIMLENVKYQLDSLRKEKERADINISNIKAKFETIINDRKKVEDSLKAQIIKTRNNKNRNDLVKEKVDELNGELRHFYQENTELERQKHETFREIEMEKEIIRSMTKQYNTQLMKIEKQNVENKRIFERNEKLVEEKNILYLKKKEHEKQLESVKVQWHRDQSKIDDLHFSKSILKKKLRTNQSEMQRQHKEKLKVELKNVNDEKKIVILQRQSASVLEQSYMFEKEKQKYKYEAIDLKQRYYRAKEEIAIQNKIQSELKMRKRGGLDKLKQQENLYEVIKSDRNLFAKKLNETRERINKMKVEFDILNKKRRQFTEEIDWNERKITKVTKRISELKLRGIANEKKMKLKIEKKKNLRALRERLKKNIATLNDVIRTGDREYKEQSKDLTEIQNDRDILSTQLIKRNQELALVYEKIEIQQSLLKKGEKDFNETQGKLKEMYENIDRLTRKVKEVKPKLESVQGLKRDYHKMEKEYINEQHKHRALKDELSFPVNVHSWRALEGVDPVTYENILKINTLQKRIIDKNSQIKKLDSHSSDLTGDIGALKKLLARQHGKEVYEELKFLQEGIVNNNDRIEKMNDFLQKNIYVTTGQKREIAKRKMEISELKKSIYEMKEKKKKKEPTMEKYPINKRPDMPQFMGGGFRYM